MRSLRTTLFILPLLLLMLSQTGCLLAAAAAGTGAGVAYVKGKTEASVVGEPTEIADATERAMGDLKIAVVSREASHVDATIVGRTASDTKVQVTAKTETDRTSKVFIRAGMWGDDPLQEKLLDRIKAQLEAPVRSDKPPAS